MINKDEYINKFLSISYALKDSFAIYVVGFPLRANELVLSFCILLGAIGKPKLIIRNKELIIIILLLVNLFHSLIVGIVSVEQINLDYFFKYIIRNFFYLVIFLLFFMQRKQFSEKDVHYLCKSVFLFSLVAFIVLYVSDCRFELGNIINTKSTNSQLLNFWGITLPRFAGVASEAGYLGPFLMLPFYFYTDRLLRRKESKMKVIILIVMILMTFSIYVYSLSLVIFLYALHNGGSPLQKIIFFIFFVFLVCLFFFYINIHSDFYIFVNSFFIAKVQASFSLNVFEYSGTDRAMHFTYCIYQFQNLSFIRKIIGLGTGGYALSVTNNFELYSLAEEAYNLFLSTLLDRGIIGICFLIGLFIMISKYHIRKEPISSALYIGIISQWLHWLITGNMWLCYFWMEFLYLIGFYYWKKENVIKI